MICGGLIQLLWTKHAAFPEDDAIYIFVTKEIWKKNTYREKDIQDKYKNTLYCNVFFVHFVYLFTICNLSVTIK